MPSNTVDVQQPGLSAVKQALLAKWIRGEATQGSTPPVDLIPRRTDSGPAPLSFGQQRLWFFYQLERDSPLYTMPIATRLKGVLQPEALRQALDIIAGRHDALRTRFIGENPDQSIAPASSVPMSIVDLREFPAAEREAEARRVLESEARRPFDLSRDLMIRAALVQIEDREWIFLVLMHHIASDDWSWRVICREVATVYEALISGRSGSLTDVAVQYADFAVWQRQWLRGPALDKLLDYWRGQLAGAPTILELPSDRARPARQTFRGACEWVQLPAETCAQLGAVSQRFGATLFMTLLAGFQTLLYRYTGQEDILIGTPVAGRNRVNLENAVGLFVNTLVLRANLSGNPKAAELIARVQATVFEALAHQELPFEKLVEELQPQRSASHLPLVQALFALQDELANNLRLSGTAISPYDIDTGTAKFDLTLTWVKDGAALNCCAEYNTDLFEAGTIRRLLQHYCQLLREIVANPDQRVSELPLLSSAERTQLISEWNSTQADYPRRICVHELFARQAGRTPGAIAVRCDGEQLSYRELDRRAARLAARLRSLGLKPKSLVAICLDRSVEMIVGLLGILKAGAAYLPLDGSYPSDRLQFMLEDSQAAWLLTCNARKSQFENMGISDIRILLVDENPPADSSAHPAAGQPENCDADLDSGATSEDLMYVIYTSGSTGLPKGVEVTHRSVVNLLHAMRQEPGLASDDTLLSVTSISFDISALEIFLPLITGARLVLAREDCVFDQSRLAALIENSGATVMQATPTLWRLLVDSGWSGRKRLKILCGGENLSRRLADELLKRGCAVWNLYGPTETTIWSACARVEPGSGPVTIGRPIANTRIYLLDLHMAPVPAGVPGELHIGGAGVARGYLNRPELTLEKFIRDPFEDSSGKLYKTGDLARYRPDGKIEYLGRSDTQVKLHGHRIDLGEIESTLRQRQGVRDAAVTVREDEPGHERLAAYVICAPGERPSARELRHFLKGKLPDYMVPATFVLLDEFPMTLNGKIDRKSLPRPSPADGPVSGAFVPPGTEAEEALAQIWREVLQLERVGVEDNFFDLGGHSLAAMQMLSRVRKELRTELSLRSLFETPTIASLASTLARSGPALDSEMIPRRRNLSPSEAVEWLGRMDTLSDQEVESLLEQVGFEDIA